MSSGRNQFYKEFNKLPYIDHLPEDETILSFHVVNKDGRLIMPLFDPNQKRFNYHSVFLFPTFYLSPQNNKLAESDVYLHSLDQLRQEFGYFSLINDRNGLEHDIKMICSVFEKYFLYMDYFQSRTVDRQIHDLYTSDIEYFFGVIRSGFDEIYSIIKKLSDIQLQETLPKSFTRFLNKLEGGVTYNFHTILTNALLDNKDMFFKLKDIRDKIYHDSNSFFQLSLYENQLAFNLKPEEISLGLWPEDKHIKSGNMTKVSVIPYLSNWTLFFLKALEEIIMKLSSTFTPLPKMSQTHDFYLRSPYIDHINKLQLYREEQWFSEPQFAKFAKK